MRFRIAIIALLLVLLPVGMALAQPPGTIYDTLVAAGNFKNLVAAIDKANVGEVKTQEGPFTMFAPTDEAFAKLPPGTLDRIMGDESIVRNVVFHHIVPGLYMAADLPGLKECGTLCPTDQGQKLELTKVGDRYMVGKANVLKADIKASNGVIHVVDTVFMPKMGPPKVP
ncbi:MAG: fasciclin domain-containing protein [Desulfobacteraceae bacterium]